jgi:tetratricopeptide (TPR) repeat protein
MPFDATVPSVPVPALKRKPYEDDLFDRFREIPDGQLLAYATDLKSDAENTRAPAVYRAYCYDLWGLVLFRLGDIEESASKHRRAHVLSPSARSLAMLGARQLLLARPEEAMESLATAADMSPSTWILSNLASAFAGVGAFAEARETFQDAVKAADLTDAVDLFTLAQHAGELGLAAEAAEYFARYLAAQHGFFLGEERAVDVLLQCWPGVESALEERFPALFSSLRQVIAFEKATQAPGDETPPSGDGLDMFEATRPMREMAAEEHGRKVS